MKKASLALPITLFVFFNTFTFATSLPYIDPINLHPIDKKHILDYQSKYNYQTDHEEDMSERTPLSLNAAILFLFPSSGIVPSKQVSPGLRIGTAFEKDFGRVGLEAFLFQSTGIDRLRAADPSEEPIEHESLKVKKALTIKDFVGTLSKPYAVAKGLFIEPLVGLEYTSINRRYQVFSEDKSYQERGVISNFQGIGPQAGFKTRFSLFKNLNLIGSLTQSALLNQSSSNWEQHRKWTPVTKVKAGIDLTIGEPHEQFFSTVLGYDGQYWANELSYFNGSHIETSNLGVHGFFLEACLNF